MADAEASARFRWLRLASLGFATVFVICGVAAIILASRHILEPDFLSFWAAGRLALGGNGAAAYDVVRHGAVEAQAVPNAGFLPFAYPPPFLLFVLPFAVAPFWIAFALWIGVTACLYAAASRRLVDLRFSLAQAAAAANFIVGQNGFLTAAIFIRGTELLATRPMVAGAVLGLLSVKPQLALLIPVALLAGREWRAIVGGLITSVALSVIALLLFGSDAYRGFLGMLPQVSGLLSEGRWPWGELASPFALLRFFGVSQVPALVVHGVIAIVAVAMTGWAWARRLEQRVPILAAASLLVPPYLFTYDGLLLTLPLAWMLRSERGPAATAVWLLTLLPLIAYFRPFPNTIPLAAMLSLWVLGRTHRTAATSYQV